MKTYGARTLRIKGFGDRERFSVSIGDKQLGTHSLNRQGMAIIELPEGIASPATVTIMPEQNRQTPRISEIRLCK
jgi:hypothetical protein